MLSDQEVLERLGRFEDNFTERKPLGSARDFPRTIVAFANSGHESTVSILYIGVRNDGTPEGLSDQKLDSLQKTIREICEQRCYPRVDFQTKVLNKNGLDFLAVLIPPSRNRPHFAGLAYVRRGSETVAASEEKFQELIEDRLSKVWTIRQWVGKAVTVVGEIPDHNYRLVGHPRWDGSYKCTILTCTKDFVELEKGSTNQRVSEPLKKIKISWDTENQRLKLQIDP